ncbi:MAG: ABC transporter substrate-binding protein [Sedimenticola sp.]
MSPFVVLLLLFAGSVHGQQHFSNPEGGYYPHQQRVSPASILEQGLNGLIQFMRQPGGVDREKLIGFVEKRVVPHFDFSHMAKWSAGRYWRQLSGKQRKTLESRIKGKFLGVMVRRLSGYDGQGARVVGARRTGENVVAVAVMLKNPKGYPTRLGFKFYRGDSGWKVFDVSANGSSALMHYRQQLRVMLRSRQQAPRSAIIR